MATLQKRKCRGYAYWSIVESIRINGKPRPVILEYLGTADSLLKKIRDGIPKKVKSYSHGSIVVMLDIAQELQIVEIINKHIKNKQLRDRFTVGGSLLLAAIGRISQPTSKRNWYEGWARYTSLSYMLRMSLSKLDSQHFWDQMEAVSVSAIPFIEEEIVKRLIDTQGIMLDTLLCDMTNFFTYIDSDNEHCSIAQRGHNKQKRMDLRQLGLLLLISRRDQIPIFHQVYQGNLVDRAIFREEFLSMLDRFKALCGSLEDITIIFDQGNNSKAMLKEVKEKIHFVGALSPYHHKLLIEEANKMMASISINDHNIYCYRKRTEIWDIDLTVVVYISERLRKGQIRGIEQQINKLFKKFAELKAKIKLPTKRGKKRTQSVLENKITSLIDDYNLPKDIIVWELSSIVGDAFELKFWINEKRFNFLKEQWFGRRILITNRHQWDTQEIILAYWGQSRVERVFRKMKNPFHLALRPQYHWTDQKIKVHGFICVLSLLLFMVAYKKAKEKGFKGSSHSLLEKLSAIRLATFIESPQQKTKGCYKATYSLEEMEEDISFLAEIFNITNHKLKTDIPFSVYI